MAAIKRFFQKRKLDVKFKKAGEGKQLDSERPPPVAVRKDFSPQHHRAGPSEEKERAAVAAMARQQEVEKKTTNPHMIAKARLRKEMETEKRLQAEAEVKAQKYREPPKEELLDSSLGKGAVLFKCPEISPAVLPKEEMEAHIHEFLLSQLAEEPEMTSALMIHTLNKDKTKVNVCIETLCKYLENIIGNPEEEKFHKIRMSNKAFKERVAALTGTEEFMQAAGFGMKLLPFEDSEEYFYVLDKEMVQDVERLKNLKDVLLTAEPIKPQLDRGLRVFYGSKAAGHFTIPDEFYAIKPDELRKEQQRRQEAVEQLGMLRTKAMRERDEQRELRKYRYTFIRVRFPDEIILQGTFKAQEKLSGLFEFVRENLINDWMPFQLVTQTGTILKNENSTMAEEGLTPSAVINLEWDKKLVAEIAAQQGGSQKPEVLKPEVMALIQTL